MQNNVTSFGEQIRVSQYQAMQDDEKMICFGLGINDPKAIFNTTQGLKENFGSSRVFDTPTSENAMTGIGIGAALSGHRVLMTHQRVDFFLLALDQLINNAAKWHFMFNGTMSVPITIRLIIGRGWGQGPTHQQNLQSWFAHIPGLKVITPGLTANVGALLYQAIMDNNPVVFLEHRWLHQQTSKVSQCLPFHFPVNTTNLVSVGNDVTVICNSYLLSEVLNLKDYLKVQSNISLDIIEVSEPSSIDWTVIIGSVNKTKKCIVLDIDHQHISLSSEISSQIYDACYTTLEAPVKRLALPPYPEPTSVHLTKNYYINQNDIIQVLSEFTGKKLHTIETENLHDVPGDWFKGPF